MPAGAVAAPRPRPRRRSRSRRTSRRPTPTGRISAITGPRTRRRRRSPAPTTRRPPPAGFRLPGQRPPSNRPAAAYRPSRRRRARRGRAHDSPRSIPSIASSIPIERAIDAARPLLAEEGGEVESDDRSRLVGAGPDGRQRPRARSAAARRTNNNGEATRERSGGVHRRSRSIAADDDAVAPRSRRDRAGPATVREAVAPTDAVPQAAAPLREASHAAAREPAADSASARHAAAAASGAPGRGAPRAAPAAAAAGASSAASATAGARGGRDARCGRGAERRAGRDHRHEHRAGRRRDRARRVRRPVTDPLPIPVTLGDEKPVTRVISSLGAEVASVSGELRVAAGAARSSSQPAREIVVITAAPRTGRGQRRRCRRLRHDRRGHTRSSRPRSRGTIRDRVRMPPVRRPASYGWHEDDDSGRRRPAAPTPTAVRTARRGQPDASSGRGSAVGRLRSDEPAVRPHHPPDRRRARPGRRARWASLVLVAGRRRARRGGGIAAVREAGARAQPHARSGTTHRPRVDGHGPTRD